MKDIEYDHGLFDSLRDLYSRIASRMWRRRLTSYRHDGCQVAEVDIAAELFERITKIAPAHPAKPRELEVRTLSQGGRLPPTEIRPPALSSAADGDSISPGESNRLAEHFEIHHTGAVVSREMSGELKKRTWEHIHSALRSARQGDAKVARLHADLANSAFGEAVHYLSGEDTAAFVTEIKQKLDEVRRSL